jgi:hypothetical protein
MLDLSNINRHTLPGRMLRAPLRLIPSDLVVPVVQGPLRGARWVVGSSTHGCWLGCYEAKSQAVCVRHVSPGLVAFDLGANAGFYTLLFSRLVGSRGRVYAFEPSPRALRYLRRHVSLNALGNVVVREMAVGAVSGEVTFVEGESLSTGRTVDDMPTRGEVVSQGDARRLRVCDGEPSARLREDGYRGKRGCRVGRDEKGAQGARPRRPAVDPWGRAI